MWRWLLVGHDWFAPFGEVTREPHAKGDWIVCSQATVSQAIIHDSALHAKRKETVCFVIDCSEEILVQQMGSYAVFGKEFTSSDVHKNIS